MPYSDPVAQALVAAALAELAMRYGGEGDATPINGADFSPPDGCFLAAFVDGRPVGCGAWRTLAGSRDTAELKRMYTAPEFRGRGVAGGILRALEKSAHAAGRHRAVLETGTAQPEAIAMYERYGYARIPGFGHYRDHADCVSFGRDLVSAGRQANADARMEPRRSRRSIRRG